jgi:hypothetical protein
MGRCTRDLAISSPRWSDHVTAKRLLIAFSPLVLLAACGKEAPADDSRSASGEVLQGTASDAMLPLDTVKSEPPFEDPVAARQAQEGAGTDGAAGAEPAEGETPEGEPTEAPAAEPTPETAD